MLVEMVVLVSVFGTLMILAAVSLQRSFHVQKVALQVIRHQQTLQDFQVRLRRDVHRADVDRLGESQEFFLEIFDTRENVIRYFLEGDLVIRQKLSPDGQVLGKQTWPLAVRSITTAVQRSESSALLRCSVQLHPERSLGVPADFSVISRVGVEPND